MRSPSTHIGLDPADPNVSPRYLPRFFVDCLWRWADYQAPDGQAPIGWLDEEWNAPPDTAMMREAIDRVDAVLGDQRQLASPSMQHASPKRLDDTLAGHAQNRAAAVEVLRPVLARGLERRCGRFLRQTDYGLALYALLVASRPTEPLAADAAHAHVEAVKTRIAPLANDCYSAWLELTTCYDTLNTGAPLASSGLVCERFGLPVTLHVCDGCTAVFAGNAGAGRCRLCSKRVPAPAATLEELAQPLLTRAPRAPLTRRVANHHNVPTLVKGWERVTLRICEGCRKPMLAERNDAKVHNNGACGKKRSRRLT